METCLLLMVLVLPGVLCSLPTDLSVTSYNVSLKVTSNLTVAVEGNATITLACITPTNKIVMHWGSSLTPNPPQSNFVISYSEPGGGTAPAQDVNITSSTVNATSGHLTIVTNTSFATDGVVTIIANMFHSKINDDSKGLFYRQNSADNNTILLTNLWPTFARELFPCLDEPQYSGKFTLTLTYPDSWSGAATTSANTTETGTNQVTFNTIALPPSNFAFFLASNMSWMYYNSSRTTKLYFWSRESLPSYTVSVNAEFLASYYYAVEEVLGITLPTQQLTIVMVPGLEEPFAGYGVIFIREDNYNRDYTNAQLEGFFKTNVAPVIYQFIRQFTEFSTRPSSWPDYWVSQATAKYMQYLILNMAMPLLDFKTDLEVVARQTALFLDSQLDTTPLHDTSIDSDSTASVQTVVSDPLKGLKGATILNMLDQSLPAGTIFSSITKFLAANQNKQITTSDFLSVIQNYNQGGVLSPYAQKALTSTLPYWFDSTTYPLETVKTVKYSSSNFSGIVSFTTAAFCSLFNPDCSLPGSFYVSATVGSKNEPRYYTPRQDFWVSNEAQNNTVNNNINVQPNDWVVANMKSGGYYRSNYTVNDWELIISALSSGDERLMGRTQLLDDAFALSSSSSGALNYNITLRLAIANLGNTLYKDWVPVQRGLQGFKNSLLGLDLYTSYKDFATGYFLRLNGFLQNKPTDTFEKARIQALFLDDFCENDISGYRASGTGNLTYLLQGGLPTTVPSSTYDALACCGARYSSNLKAQYLWNILSDSTSNYYRRRVASIALGCLSNYSDIAQLFNTMTEAPNQLVPYIQITLENVAEKNPVKFLANFTQLVEKYQSKLGAASVASLIKRAGQKINNITQAAVLKDLNNNDNIDPLVKTAATNTIGAINFKVTWLANNNKSLVLALQSNTYSTSSSKITVVSPVIFFSCLLFLLPSRT